MFKFLKRFFCGHPNPVFTENLYGDVINIYNARSLWRCPDCGALVKRSYLHIDKDGNFL